MVKSKNSIATAQSFMQSSGISGWLIRDYRYTNPAFTQVMGEQVEHLTRPVWMAIPASSDPKIIVHSVDAGRFPEGSPQMEVYRNRKEMRELLEDFIFSLAKSGAHSPKIAMEYSPLCELPRVSRTDAGSVDLVKAIGAEVVSSGDLLQYAAERWTPTQLQSHRIAAAALTEIVQEAFKFVGQNIGWQLTEHDIAEFIRGQFARKGLETADGPCVAFNEHSADPHYTPEPESAAIIRRDGWLLIDLWAKQKNEQRVDDPPVYADITWVAALGRPSSGEIKNVFQVVKDARNVAFEFIVEATRKGMEIQGWEVDRKARELIVKAGYGDGFVHRLGHSLGTEVHSNAVNLDDWETHDTRTILEGLGLTIEPGVYLREFGVRLEMDIFMSPDGPEITTPPQKEPFFIETR